MPFVIIVLALGTFAIGTDGYLVAGLLPNIADDMKVTVGVAGQLVTLFAIAYAFGSPLLSTLTANVGHKRILLSAMLLFTLANLASTLVPSAIWLFGTRLLAALGASLYTPTAMATATQLVDVRQRGRALATVIAGSTGALVLGLPLGSWIGTLFGWRASFGMVALIGAASTLLLALLLPPVSYTSSAVTWHERLALLSKRHVLLVLGLTFVSLVGANSILTYVVPLLQRLTTFKAEMLSAALLGIGVASFVGNLIGGYLADRWGISRMLIRVYGSLVVITMSFSFLMLFPKSTALNAVVIVVFALWGIISWLGAPALNGYLASLEPQSTTVALSLNVTALYLGVAGAGSIGGFVLTLGGIAYMGLVCGLIEVLALAMALLSIRVGGAVSTANQRQYVPPATQESAKIGNQ
jgi:predicted MFS family arabinose efflux permease